MTISRKLPQRPKTFKRSEEINPKNLEDVLRHIDEVINKLDLQTNQDLHPESSPTFMNVNVLDTLTLPEESLYMGDLHVTKAMLESLPAEEMRGVAVFVSADPPADPQTNDIWIKIT